MKLKHFLAVMCALSMVPLAGCDRQGNFAPVDMWNRSRYKPYEETGFFADKSSSRAIPVNTVARGQLRTDEPYYYGTINGTYVTYNPLARTEKVKGKPGAYAEMLQRGQERYQVFCQMCHGESGYGNGMIVKRGFSPPPSYHIARLTQAPDGHLYDVIANGYGAMYSYASRIPVEDRWAIVAYIRAIQRSQKGVKQKDLGYKKQRDLAGTGSNRDLSKGESAAGEAGPNESSRIAPVPAIIGPNDKAGNAENQKAG